ncbi:MAG: heat-inducible transcription repressor HrcA, partial [Ignavibacteriaceae bacterium]|nr:heat-inducible transcription repressor HrcA [Ignavibacteriaceae bacterium]
MLNDDLNAREKSILRYVVQQFIVTASPVGSRNITKKYNLGISPATVRNIMSDLEESGYIGHPHTSAGRIPTDKGYRMYVDDLMEIQALNSEEKKSINKDLDTNSIDQTEILDIATKILSRVTNQLACIVYPKFDAGILQKIQLIYLSSNKILIVITIKSGLLKTVTIELDTEISESSIEPVQSLLNEKLSGLKLSEIRLSFSNRIKESASEDNPIFRILVESADKIFSDIRTGEKVAVTGAKNLLLQPEFEDPLKFHSVVDLIEDKEIILHIFENSSGLFLAKRKDVNGVSVVIGQELPSNSGSDYSLVTKEYKVGNVSGTMGVIGPKRMDYSKICLLYTSPSPR